MVSNWSSSAKRAVVGLDRVEGLLAVVHQVHLVDRQHHVLDAQACADHRVPACLCQDALACVDQDHRDVGRRGPGYHVPGVLLVARRVGDDELPAVGREEPVRDVDRDPLLTLGGEPVDQEREVDVAALGPHLLGVAPQRRDLVLEDQLRLEQHPPDQGRLAVVDRAAGDEPERVERGLLLEVGVDPLDRVVLCLCVHQK